MPSFGKTTIGQYSYELTQDELRGVNSTFKPEFDGRAGNIWVYLKIAPKAKRIKCAIYRVSDNSLIGKTVTVEKKTGKNPQWIKLDITEGGELKANEAYYLSLLAEKGVVIYHDSKGGKKQVRAFDDDCPSSAVWEDTPEDFSIYCNYRAYVYDPSMKLLEATKEPKQFKEVPYVRFFTQDLFTDETILHPLGAPCRSEGFNQTDYLYSCWKHITGEISFEEGTVTNIRLTPLSSVNPYEGVEYLIATLPGTIGCPLDSYDVARYYNRGGFPIDSTIPNSLGHAYYRVTGGFRNLIDYYGETLLIDNAEYTVTPFTFNFAVLQVRASDLFRIAYPFGEFPEEVWIRPNRETSLNIIYDNIQPAGTFPFTTPVTLRTHVVTGPYKIWRINASSFSLYSARTLMVAIEYPTGADSGTIKAWDDELLTTTKKEIFRGTPYSPGNSLLRAYKVAEDVPPNSTQGTLPANWYTQAIDDTSYQMRGNDYYITHGTIGQGNQVRLAFLLLVPYDVERKKTAYMDFVLSVEGKFRGSLAPKILANVGTDQYPYWVEFNTIAFTGIFCGYKRTIYERAKELDKIRIPLSSFDYCSDLWIKYGG